jgi:hypothetical protein
MIQREEEGERGSLRGSKSKTDLRSEQVKREGEQVNKRVRKEGSKRRKRIF